MTIHSPFVLFVGPTKSGTTWIHAYLEERGDLAMPTQMKETFFFDKVYKRGFTWYENLFPGKEDTRLRAEVAPSLFHKPEACERAHLHIPFAKIICTVRDPHDRAVSHYFHYRKRGLPKLSLEQASQEYYDIVDAGRYAEHGRRWEETFGKDKVFFMSYQQLRDDPYGFCRELCDILDIEYIAPTPELLKKKVNAAGVPRSNAVAKVVQKVASWMRMNGWHAITGTLKRIPIKKWLYSGGTDLDAERKEIRQQAKSFSPELSADWDMFAARPDFPDT